MPRLTLQLGDRSAAMLDAECQAAGVDRAEYVRRALATYAYLRGHAAVNGRVRFAGPDGRPKDLVLDGPRVSRRAMPAARLAGLPVAEPDPGSIPSNPIPFRSPQPHAGTPMPTETATTLSSDLAAIQSGLADIRSDLDSHADLIASTLGTVSAAVGSLEAKYQELATKIVGAGDLSVLEKLAEDVQFLRDRIGPAVEPKSPETDGDNTPNG